MAGERIQRLAELFKLVQAAWPYIKQLIDLFNGLNPAQQQLVQQIVTEVVTDYQAVPAEQRGQFVEQLTASLQKPLQLDSGNHAEAPATNAKK